MASVPRNMMILYKVDEDLYYERVHFIIAMAIISGVNLVELMIDANHFSDSFIHSSASSKNLLSDNLW